MISVSRDNYLAIENVVDHISEKQRSNAFMFMIYLCAFFALLAFVVVQGPSSSLLMATLAAVALATRRYKKACKLSTIKDMWASAIRLDA